MSYILSIDTSTKVCSVALHLEGNLVGQQSYHLQKSHSTLLPVIIEQVLQNAELTTADLNAIAISEGPGSYTGLRIGTSTAKGLAYSLGIPLVAVSSLDSMLEQVRSIWKGTAFFCPMIDARRMEIYCKLVDHAGQVLWQTAPVIVDEETFAKFRNKNLVLFGNGSDKLQELLGVKEFVFVEDIHPSASFMGRMALEKIRLEEFVDVAYFEPDYLKEFRTIKPKPKLKL